MNSKLFELVESGQKENIQLALTISENPADLVEKYHQVLIYISKKGGWYKDDKLEYWEDLESDMERLYALISRNQVIMENCGLVEIPKEIFPLKNLEYLFLENNMIENIAEEILIFPKLISLYLFNNPITYDNDKMSALQKLIPQCQLIFR